MRLSVQFFIKIVCLFLLISFAVMGFSDPSYVQALPSDDLSQTVTQDDSFDQTGTDAFGQPVTQAAPTPASTPTPADKNASNEKKAADLSPMDASAQSTLLLSRMMQVNQDFLGFESKTSDQINQLQASTQQYASQISLLQTVNQQYDSKITQLQTVNQQYDSKITQLQTVNQQYDSQITQLQTVNQQYASQINQLQTMNKQMSSQMLTLAAQLELVQSKITNITQEQADPMTLQVHSLRDFKKKMGVIPFYSIVGIFALLVIIIFLLMISLMISKKNSKEQVPQDNHKSDYDYLSTKEAIPAKLDLARSYIVMEDFEGAKHVLTEVLKEGDEEQKELAKNLLDECEPKETNA